MFDTLEMWGFILLGCALLAFLAYMLIRRLGKERRSFRDTLRDIAWRLNPMRILRRKIDDAVDGYANEREAMRTHKAKCDGIVVQNEYKLKECIDEIRRREEEAGIVELRKQKDEIRSTIQKKRRDYELTGRSLRRHAWRHPVMRWQLVKRQKAQSSHLPREINPYGQLSLEESSTVVSTNTSKVKPLPIDVEFSTDSGVTA